MKAGKPSGAVLSRSVIKQLNKDPRAKIPRSRQLDYGGFPLEDRQVVVSTQTVAYPVTRLGRFGVMSAVNNILCSGARPEGVTLSLLFPTIGNEQQLRELIREADGACAELGIPVLGGHTDILSEVKEPILTVTAVGSVSAERRIPSNGAKPGMDLVLTKYAGLAGTAVIAAKKREELLTRYAAPFLDRATRFDEGISVRTEAMIAADYGAAALHDVSLGGLYGALWEMAESGNVGLTVDLKAIPIKQETVELCEFFDLNPYKLFGAGALLIATDSGEGLVEQLAAAETPAAIIGHTTEGRDRILVTGEESRFLECTQSDELYKIAIGINYRKDNKS